MSFRLKHAFVILALAVSGCTSFCRAQSTQQKPPPGADSAQVTPASNQSDVHPSPGTIKGTVVDPTGAVIGGARVQILGPGWKQETRSGADGQFSFSNVAAGAFQIAITASGFALQNLSGTLQPGEIQTVPPIALNVAENVTEVEVDLTQVQVAEEQVKEEEKQRVLAVIPNFYVSYIPNAAPLNAKQKFSLAWKTVIDPFTFVVVAGAAGVEQAQNHFAGYGQGTQGYAKRFGAGYADTVAGTFVGAAILPALLRQDPRYFYKGTGSTASRFAYAVSNAFICKGDNARWQPNYSNVLGNLAAGGLSNLYYPEQDRNGAELTLENAAIGIGATAIANLFQEFIVRRLTPKVPKQSSGKP
jgi:hypothetical protein